MAEKHFYEQINYTEKYLISYMKSNIEGFSTQKKILDLGCAEGGTVYHLTNQGYICDGLEIEAGRARIAQKYTNGKADIFICDITQPLKIQKRYDIIIMRDVIEHISQKEKALNNISKLLNENGVLFLTFPLKYSPYAGHNQNAKNWLKYFWYITLLPKSIIKLLVPKRDIDNYLYLKENALSFYKLKQLLQNKWKFIRIDFFISRPIFKIRLGWPIVKFPQIPIIREFTNGCEVLVRKS